MIYRKNRPSDILATLIERTRIAIQCLFHANFYADAQNLIEELFILVLFCLHPNTYITLLISLHPNTYNSGTVLLLHEPRCICSGAFLMGKKERANYTL